MPADTIALPLTPVAIPAAADRFGRRPVPLAAAPGTGVRGLAADALVLLAVVWAIPFVIIAVGMPLALAIRAVLWVAQAL